MVTQVSSTNPFIVDYQGVDGESYQETFSDREDAEAFVAETRAMGLGAKVLDVSEVRTANILHSLKNQLDCDDEPHEVALNAPCVLRDGQTVGLLLDGEDAVLEHLRTLAADNDREWTPDPEDIQNLRRNPEALRDGLVYLQNDAWFQAF